MSKWTSQQIRAHRNSLHNPMVKFGAVYQAAEMLNAYADLLDQQASAETQPKPAVSGGWRSDQWEPKKLWKRRGKGFTVEVSRHQLSEAVDSMSDKGIYRWCVYVYVYPEHPRFADFDKNRQMLGQPNFGMHGGNSFFHVHLSSDGDVASYQVGSDYNHEYDSHFTRYKTPIEAGHVFADADSIFVRLQNEATKDPQA